MGTSSAVISARGRQRLLYEARELVTAWRASGQGVAKEWLGDARVRGVFFQR